MKKNRPNRMLKPGDTIKRDEVTPGPPEPAQGDDNPEPDDGDTGFPCNYCRGETFVIQTFRAFETVQEPIKIIKKRRRRCKVCNRSFVTQESQLRRPV